MKAVFRIVPLPRLIPLILDDGRAARPNPSDTPDVFVLCLRQKKSSARPASLSKAPGEPTEKPEILVLVVLHTVSTAALRTAPLGLPVPLIRLIRMLLAVKPTPSAVPLRTLFRLFMSMLLTHI